MTDTPNDPYDIPRTWVLDARNRALALRQRSSARQEESRRGSELSGVDQHQADSGSELLEQEVDASMLISLDAELAELDAALGRLDSGAYGRCEWCGSAIGDDRLRAVPATRFCADHERLAEGFGSPLALEPSGQLTGADPRDQQTTRDAAGFLDLLPSDDPSEEVPAGVDDTGPEATAVRPLPER